MGGRGEGGGSGGGGRGEWGRGGGGVVNACFGTVTSVQLNIFPFRLCSRCGVNIKYSKIYSTEQKHY